jgi:hypothetical protein
MISINSLRKFCVFSLLAVFYATILTAAELPSSSQPENSVAQGNQTGMNTSLDIMAGNTGEYFKEYNVNPSGSATMPSLRTTSDIFSPDYLNDRFKGKYAITLYKDSQGNKLSVASMGDGFTMNPVTDIRNLGVILQIKF